MLNNTLLPTAYLAPIQYYSILLQSEQCIIDIHENFVKQTIRNRCYLYSSNGKIFITIPRVRKKSSTTKTKDIKISYRENWQKIHWNTIISAYNSSPFFKYYKEDLEKIFFKREKYLLDFNNNLTELILSFISEKKHYAFSNKYDKKIKVNDFRNSDFHLNFQQKYQQVFMEKFGFIANMSIIDLLFNVGPESKNYLFLIDLNCKIKNKINN